MSSVEFFRRLSVAAIAAASVWLSGCGGDAADAPPPARPVMAVELTTASKQQWPDVLSASGEIAPWQEAIIGAEVAGVRLEEVLADVGDVVTKGQLLARYNEDSLRAELAQLDARVAEAEVNVQKARADASRADRLEASDALSQQAIQAYRATAAVAEAQLASAQAQRQAQALRLRYARIVAPDDGVVSSRTATVGAVGTLGAELFRLVRRGRLEWRAEMPAEALARLQPATRVELQLPDGTLLAGTIRQISPTVDPRTRNGIVYVDLPRQAGVAAGMYVSGRFTLAQREALTVPETAIVMRDGSRYLMQVDADNRAHQVKVISGRRRDGALEILEGLAPGQRFVVSGGAFLSDGDLVGVTAAAAQP
ncbi:MAG TPA: efflux RND transporter periplasmic adaptor subunit [Fontimonas sp.]